MNLKKMKIKDINKRGFFKGISDERNINVLYTDVGEIVKGRIFTKKGKLYCDDIKEIIQKSKHRIKPECKYYYRCGGCCYQHLTYEREKQIKTKKAKDLLGGLPEAFEFSKIYNYRNSLEFDVTKNKAGMHPRMSPFLININKCELMTDEINQHLKDAIQENKKEFDGEVRVVLDDNGIVSRWYPKYESKETSIANLKYGKKKLNSKVFYISPDTFFQANEYLYPRWLEKIKFLIQEEKDRFNSALELFSGVGTISFYVEELFKKIRMVENNENSLFLAYKAIEKMGLEKDKFDIIKKDLFQESPSESDLDVLILNPPRAGLSKKIIKFINKSSFKFIIYSSCNYKTFARDIKKLEQYELDKYYIYDMFPRTYHFEILSKLKKE
ncbi:MAG: class I SAM-dependent RNA methyltransferase [Candidatus Mcinerneyibacterium aminivorans]|uniref:Class I SAM-dependent RNA methyltransferase n=1 Tax=Candidatus Mcinerneyibacterium aminivorans TaxID=2703815 RepID=A0A5D0MGX4_9BACT|nr:MAG: class I SAM-dependent RNA methyltransferase [Candidatus Mcinerneyibacterium aminivorans]